MSSSDCLAVTSLPQLLVTWNTRGKLHELLDDAPKHSQPRVYRFTFQCEDSEDAFVNPAEWFFADEPLQRFDTECELSQGE